MVSPDVGMPDCKDSGPGSYEKGGVVSMDTQTFRKMRRYKALYILFIPIVLYLLVFTYYPFVRGLVMSFQENRLIGKRPFAGLSNYAKVVADPDFIASIVNSLIIGVVDMVLYFVLALLLALMINEIRSSTMRKSIQTIAYIPYLFSWAVIGGVWALIFDIKGLVNAILGFFGQEAVFFLAETSLARPLIIGMGVWRSVGYFALLFSVAIVGIDPTLFEAAKIDGASRLTQIRKIIIPSLSGTMKTIIVLLSIGVLTHFDEIYVMVNPANRRFISTLLLYVYETGILNFRMGTASAGATLVMIGTVLIATVMRRLTRYDEE
jgi:putative aldouronate transport system permease protein